MRRYDIRWLIVFAANLALCFLLGLGNHYLAPIGIHLYAGGLLVAYAALRLDETHGFVAMVLTALAVDSTMPVPFGTSLVLFGLVHAVLVYGRMRFPREEILFGTVVSLFCNLFLFLALSFLMVGENPRPGHAWSRLFIDLIASQLLVGVITPWFLSIQTAAHAQLGIHPETGRRVML